MGYQIEQTSKQTNHRRLQAQEKFIGEVIDEFLRVRGTDAAEEKRGGRCGREQHVTLELPPGLLQKLPELQERLQHMHAAALAADPALAMYGASPTECVIEEGSVLGLAGLAVTLQRMGGSRAGARSSPPVEGGVPDPRQIQSPGGGHPDVHPTAGAGADEQPEEELHMLQWFGSPQLHASFAAQALVVRVFHCF